VRAVPYTCFVNLTDVGKKIQYKLVQFQKLKKKKIKPARAEVLFLSEEKKRN
jgi:hypothetical protein